MEHSMLALLIAAQVTMASTEILDHENIFWSDYSTPCHLGHDHDGDPVSDEVRARSCIAEEVLREFFTYKGYCYIETDAGSEWVVCG
jgi:hypothetical protein